jgi:hypothetical protein
VKRLSRLLGEGNASGVYLLAGSSRIDAVEKLATENGLAFFLVQGHEIHRKDEFLKAAADALGFPEYFGHNWDAFEDCLKDMSWHPAGGYVMVLEGFDGFAGLAPDEFRIAMDILRDSAEFWSGQGKTMIGLLVGVEKQAGTLPSVDV